MHFVSVLVLLFFSCMHRINKELNINNKKNHHQLNYIIISIKYSCVTNEMTFLFFISREVIS